MIDDRLRDGARLLRTPCFLLHCPGYSIRGAIRLSIGLYLSYPTLPFARTVAAATELRLVTCCVPIDRLVAEFLPNFPFLVLVLLTVSTFTFLLPRLTAQENEVCDRWSRAKPFSLLSAWLASQPFTSPTPPLGPVTFTWAGAAMEDSNGTRHGATRNRSRGHLSQRLGPVLLAPSSWVASVPSIRSFRLCWGLV